VDHALADANAARTPLGVLIGRPLALGGGIMLVGWPDGGPAQYHVIETRPRPGRGAARYMQVVEFPGPRSEEWVAAGERAAGGRLGPATDAVDGIVSVLRLRAAADAYLVIVLAESMDAFDVASQAIMSTELLPGRIPRSSAAPTASASTGWSTPTCRSPKEAGHDHGGPGRRHARPRLDRYRQLPPR